jgi:hypothetical protein
MIAMITLTSIHQFWLSSFTYASHLPSLIVAYLVDRNLKFHSAPILDLGKTYRQDSVSEFGSSILNAHRPAQRDDPAKPAITSLRTEMREYAIARLATYFFSPDSKLRISGTNLNMFGR